MGFHGVSANKLMEHTMERYGKTRASYLKTCRQALMASIEVDLLLDVYFQRVEDVIQFAQDGKMPLTPTQIVQTAYHAVNKTDIYYLALK